MVRKYFGLTVMNLRKELKKITFHDLIVLFIVNKWMLLLVVENCRSEGKIHRFIQEKTNYIRSFPGARTYAKRSTFSLFHRPLAIDLLSYG
jgi:hypothetical protein